MQQGGELLGVPEAGMPVVSDRARAVQRLVHAWARCGAAEAHRPRPARARSTDGRYLSPNAVPAGWRGSYDTATTC